MDREEERGGERKVFLPLSWPLCSMGRGKCENESGFNLPLVFSISLRESFDDAVSD